MGGREADIRALGAKLVFVGSGSPAHARDFRDTQHVAAPLYVDPSLELYRVLGFRAGLGSTLGGAALRHGLRAFKAGFRQGATQGAPFQQGGAAIVLPDGSVPWVFRSEAAGDHPDPDTILAALRAATAPR